MNRDGTNGTGAGEGRGFTLLELLVVMVVIGLIIAITFPALSGVRDSARRAGTTGLMTNITQAVSKFENDHRRMPGYFSAREMGDVANDQNAGMSAMENAILELTGAQVVRQGDPSYGSLTTGWIEIGPATSRRAKVNIDLMGSAGEGARNYYSPDAKHFIPQTGLQQVGGLANTAADGMPQLPDVVDDWGQPLLAWVQDDTAIGSAPFAVESWQTSQPPARFYWQSNACFLSSTSLGKKGRDQTSSDYGSWIGLDPAITAQKRAASLVGILGNPSSPYRPANAPPDFVPSMPTAARGQFIVHSAGSDGVYFGKRDKASAGVRNMVIDYRSNFVPDPSQPLGPGNEYLTRDGKRDVNDFAKEFDDLMAVAGN